MEELHNEDMASPSWILYRHTKNYYKISFVIITQLQKDSAILCAQQAYYPSLNIDRHMSMNSIHKL